MRKIPLACLCIIALMAITIWAPNASAAPSFRFQMPFWGSCLDCHPDVSLGFGGPSHFMHADPTGPVCESCHGVPHIFVDPPIGQNCTQCHGRTEDTGGDNISAGEGRGLRQHHQFIGITCSDPGCHSDSLPGSPAGVGENVPPAFYPGPVPFLQLDPCDGSEDLFPWSMSLSLDNDGDWLTDCEDPDCADHPACACGNGILDPGEDCDPLGNECCFPDCTFVPAGFPCDDGEFCTVNDTCDEFGTCQAGVPRNCSDGVGCTDDSCDEAIDTCEFSPNDANCDDGLFCNVPETCDPILDCQIATPPTPPCNPETQLCDEVNDVCVTVVGADAEAIVCHMPDDPSKQKTLIIGAQALCAHLAHGDILGPCP